MHAFRYALRTLARQPAFCASAVLTLALGIGANTAMFSVFDAAVLHPLPYRDAGRLLLVWQKPPDGKLTAVAPVNFLEWKKQTKSFDQLLGMRTQFITYRGPQGSDQLLNGQVSRGFFSALGMPPLAGREFRDGEEASDQDHVAILSYGLWRREFAGDAGVLGSAIELNGEPYKVIGFTTKEFDESLAFKGIDVWTPLNFESHASQNSSLRSNTMAVVGRLKPDVSLEEADREMRVVSQRLQSEFPDIDRGWSATVMRLQDYGVERLRATAMALLFAVAMVLLIACVNVANLLLARADVRCKDISIRAALGAGRTRLLRQLLTETMLLAVAGSLGGIALAYAGLRGLVLLRGIDLPGLHNVAINGSVLAFTCILTAITGLLFGLLPSRHLLSGDLNQAVRESGRSAMGTRRGRTSRNILIIAETALSLVLLAGALLMAHSLLWLQQEDRGFAPDHLLTFRLSLSRRDFPDSKAMTVYYRALMARLAALPGVVSAGSNTNLPLDGFVLTGQHFRLPGAVLPPSERPAAGCDLINGSYFAALHIPLLKGRPFDDRDREAAPLVAILSEMLALRYFPGENPIGHTILVASPGSASIEVPREIVGIAGDVRYLTRAAGESLQIYLPFVQATWPNLYVTLRTTGDPSALAPSVQAVLRESGYDRQSIAELRSMQDRIDALNGKPRLNSLLAAAFAAIAVFLAVVGVYGVVSYSTAQRAQEIGVRIAVGATSGDIVRWILWDSLRLTLAGLALGLAAYFAVSPVLGSLVYGVTPYDARTLAIAAIGLALLVMASSYIPARRAIRTDAIIALRSQ